MSDFAIIVIVAIVSVATMKIVSMYFEYHQPKRKDDEE